MTKRPRSRILRPPGLLVFGLLCVLVVTAWWILADRLVERGFERSATALVGALVELESADIRPTEGSLRMNGLQVTNPNAPMKNLFEAEEIVGEVMLEPLLQKKVIVERLVVTGVRFGTDRETSGEIENPDPAVRTLFSEVDAWADAIEIPELSLAGLGGAIVQTEAIDADSLASVRYARGVIRRADSLRTDWDARLGSLDPRSRVDSIEAVAQRLEGFRLTPLSALQVPGLVSEGRAALAGIESLQDEVRDLEGSVRTGLSSLTVSDSLVRELRNRDFAYARSLLNVPSLDAPSISPALFAGTALSWLKPVLYWAHAAERFLPPGLNPRNRPGPSRARAEGTTFDFREGAEYPDFLLREGDLGVILGGSGLAAGSYTARIRDLTSSPALVGRPMEFSLGRAEGAVGPQGLALSARLDRTGQEIRDSVSLSMTGMDFPSLSIAAFGGALDLGRGENTFTFRREGDRIQARMRWVSESIRWEGTGGTRAEGGDPSAPLSAEIGSAAWVDDLVRRTLAGMTRVELEMGLSGTMADPSLDVASNLGEAIATSLRNEVGREIEAAENRVRAEVTARITPLVTDARAHVTSLTSEMSERILGQSDELEQLQGRLEERISELLGGAVPEPSTEMRSSS